MNINYGGIDGDFNYTAQLNGNISQIQWRVNGYKRQTYGFNYDYLDRLTNATYGQYDDGLAVLDKNEFYSTGYTYDARGNIATLQREGKKLVNGCYEQGQIDNLIYTYLPNTNKLQLITDIANLNCLPERYLSLSISGTQTHSARNLVNGTNTCLLYTSPSPRDS